MSLTAAGGSSTISPASGTSDAVTGQVNFTVKDTKDEPVTYHATVKVGLLPLPLSATAQVTFIDSSVSAGASTVKASTGSVTADGSSAATITVTLKDGATRADVISGKTVMLSQGGGHSVISPMSGTTDSTGSVAFTVTNTTAELVTYSATDSTDGIGITQAAQVTFVPGPVDATVSTVKASPASVAADGSAASTVTVTLLDAHANPISGETVSLGQGGGNSTISVPSGSSTAAGVVTFTVTDTTSEVVTYTATPASNAALKQTASVSFGAAVADAGASSVTVSPPSVPADGKMPATATVTLLDASGHPVSGKTVTLDASSLKVNISAASGRSNGQGQVSFTLTDGTPEVVTLTVVDQTDTVSVSRGAELAFTQVCSGCQVALSPAGARADPSAGTVTAAIIVQAPSAGLGSWAITARYDATLLTPTGCDTTDSLCSFGTTPGVVTLTGQASPVLTGKQTLAHLAFAISAPTGTTSELTASAPQFRDGAGVPYQATAGSLLVVVGKQGDVNLDKFVTAVDALCVLRLVALLPQTGSCPQTPATAVMADVNGFGGVSAVDALCVLREVAQLPATASCPAGAEVASRSAGARSPNETPPPASARPPGASPTPTGPSLSPMTVRAAAGARTTVTLAIDAGSAGLGAWTVEVTYDPNAVKVASCQPAAGSLCNTNAAPGVVRITGASATGLSGDAALATLSFEGLGRGGRESAFGVTPITLADPAGAALIRAPA